MRKDDWVLLSFPSANRDPAAFERADEVVLDRAGQPPPRLRARHPPLRRVQPRADGAARRARVLLGEVPRVHALGPRRRHVVAGPGPRTEDAAAPRRLRPNRRGTLQPPRSRSVSTASTSCERDARRARGDERMEDEVGGLRGDRQVVVAGRRDGELRRLLAELLQPQVPVVEQVAHVARRRCGDLAPTALDQPVEPPEDAGGGRLGVEAARRTRVAGRTDRCDHREDGVTVAVGHEGDDALDVAGGRALVPRPTRPRPVVHLAGVERRLERLSVGVGDHEDRAVDGVDRDHGDEPAALVEVERVEVERRRSRRVGARRDLADPKAGVGHRLLQLGDPRACRRGARRRGARRPHRRRRRRSRARRCPRRPRR